MQNPDWRDSEPASPPPRRVLQGRTDFEDSLLSVRRELQAQEKRRSQVMTEALRSRPLASDPEGKLFRAQQEKAIAARRLANARQAHVVNPVEEVSVPLHEVWQDAAQTSKAPGMFTLSKPTWTVIAAAVVALAGYAAVIVLPAWLGR